LRMGDERANAFERFAFSLRFVARRFRHGALIEPEL
jgi:hypothetical protein